MNDIHDIQNEYCELCAIIYEKILRMGFKVRSVVNSNLIWAIDSSDPGNSDVMAFVMPDDDNEEWHIEITPEAIAVNTEDEEKIICYRYNTDDGVTISGFTIQDLPYLRKGPSGLDRLEREFDNLLSNYLNELKGKKQ